MFYWGDIVISWCRSPPLSAVRAVSLSRFVTQIPCDFISSKDQQNPAPPSSDMHAKTTLSSIWKATLFRWIDCELAAVVQSQPYDQSGRPSPYKPEIRRLFSSAGGPQPPLQGLPSCAYTSCCEYIHRHRWFFSIPIPWCKHVPWAVPHSRGAPHDQIVQTLVACSCMNQALQANAKHYSGKAWYVSVDIT